MKLLIDTKKKTIEVYDDTPIEDVAPHFNGHIYNEYTIVRAPQSLLGSVLEIEYNSDSTDKTFYP